MIKQRIEQGKLDLPSRSKFVDSIGEDYTYLAEQMFQALWENYLINKGSVSLPYWSDRFNNQEVFNIVLISLAKAGWIITHSIPARNWAEASINEDKLLTYVNSTELEQVRAYNKFKAYISVDSASTKSTSTRIAGRVQDTGLVREGFMLAGNTKYKYDRDAIADYSTVFAKNLTKSMDKIRDILTKRNRQFTSSIATYDTISVNILDYHIANDIVMTRGHNYNDSRGRAISSALGKVFNPISSKDARAVLEIVYEE